MAQVVCPSFSGAAVLRATKLDGCCKPVFEDPNSPGTSGQVVTDAFISIDVAPGGADSATGGSGDQVTKAGGQVCFTTTACPTPQNYTLTLSLCALDPELVLIMKPSWCGIRDSTGTLIGFTGMSSGGCDTGSFALEVWMNTASGASQACKASSGGSAYGYLLFPCVTGAQIGQWTITNGPITFSFTATTRRSAGWGRGPYNVMMDGNRPTPLQCPVRASADFVQFITTFPPPEGGCGRLPVDGGIPLPPTVFTERGQNTTGCLVQVRADNGGYGPVIIKWGDNAQSEARDGQLSTHRYNSTCNDPTKPPRQVTLSVCSKEFPQICTTRTLTIPLPRDEPVIRCYQDPADDTGKTVLVDVTLPPQAWCGPPDPQITTCACPGESPIGYYGLRVDWGEDEADGPLQYVAVAATCKTTLRHTYTAEGRFAIKVCRNDLPRYCARCTYAAGGLRPDVQFVSWDQSCTASIVIDNHRRGTVSIDWGDGRTQTGVPEGGINHSYTQGLGKSFLITVCSEDTGGGCRTLQTPICTGGGADLIAVTADCDPADPTGRTFLVTADNRGHGTVTITALGGTTSTPYNTGDGKDVTRVVYPASVTGPQTITAADPDERDRTGRATIAVPCQPGPDTTAVCDPTDDHRVTLTPGAGAKYPLSVDWGDGTPPQVFQQGQPIAHTYYKDTDPLQPQRPASLLLGRPVTLSQGTVHQQADYHRNTGEFYATQLINGGRQLAGETAPVSAADRAAHGDLAINRVTTTGTLASQMYCLGFDHGSGIGVQPDGDTTYLFTGVDVATPPDPTGDGFATKIARFPYVPNQVLRASDAGLDKYDPRPGTNHVNPCLDLDHQAIGVRYRTADTNYHIAVFRLADFMARNFASPLYDRVVDDVTTPAFQAWCVYGRYVYHFYGAGDASPRNSKFTITDLGAAGSGTAPVIATIPNDQYPDLVWREAESVFVIPTADGPRFGWGFATDLTGQRKMNLYATAAHRSKFPVTITVKDADGKTATAKGVDQIPCSTTPPVKAITVGAAKCPDNPANPGARAAITYTNANNRGVKVYWVDQDPNPTVHDAATGTVTSPRDYTPGTYQICVQDIQDSTIRTCISVCMPCGTLRPVVTCAPNPNPGGLTVALSVACANNPLTIDWGDVKQTNVQPPTDGKPITHTYPDPGAGQSKAWTVTVSDLNNPTAIQAAGSPITIPCTPPTA